MPCSGISGKSNVYLSGRQGLTWCQKMRRHRQTHRPLRRGRRGKWALLRPTKKHFKTGQHPPSPINNAHCQAQRNAVKARVCEHGWNPPESGSGRVPQNQRGQKIQNIPSWRRATFFRSVAEARDYKCRMILKECTGERGAGKGVDSLATSWRSRKAQFIFAGAGKFSVRPTFPG